MNNDFENELRNALKPVDPDKGFDERVMTRVKSERVSTIRWFPLALAASFVAVVGTLVVVQRQQQERAGIEAREQLIQALRVTGAKLDLAYHAVNDTHSDAGAGI